MPYLALVIIFCCSLFPLGQVAEAASASLGAGAVGEPFRLQEPAKFKEAKVEFKADGPTLLFSDSPEMVYKDGILYKDQVKGRVRLFFHHVNATSDHKKLAVVVKNTGLRPLQLQVLKAGIAGPDYNYLQAGKEAQQLYFTSGDKSKVQLGYARHQELLTGRGLNLPPNTLVTGMVDLDLSEEAEIIVQMSSIYNNVELFSRQAKQQPIDEHPLRGTFTKADWHYSLKNKVKAGKRPTMVHLAGPNRGYALGRDATTGLPAENYGNYGILYQLDFTVDGTKPVQLIFDPIGGEFAGYAVLEHCGSTKVLPMQGKDQLALGKNYEEALVLDKLEPGEYTLYWSPPGSGNLPVRFWWQ